jgi:hypothetical protein
MGFKRIQQGIEEIFIVVVQDPSGSIKEKWTIMKSDFNKVVRLLNEKYGLNIYKNKKDKDLDWAM